ncbi:hypothetical protein STENM223S_07690 [Streptomyces tendae]
MTRLWSRVTSLLRTGAYGAYPVSGLLAVYA